MKRAIAFAGAVVAGALVFHTPASVPVHAQNRMNFPLVAPDTGHVALGLALRRLNVSGTFLQTAAHPDDEHNQLHAMFALGQGLRSVTVQTTRGAGGQNEIGPELFQDLAVLRTSELLAAHRLDSAEQYFTRAIDFGYSFDPPEIYAKWGRQEVIADFVRFIRMLRPDVVLTMSTQGRGGDRAHEATTMLTQEAFRAAADPTRFPEQIEEGLRPWQARKLYFTPNFG
ncbi:MAG: PIG-L family deacetylase, partial [Acidobacteria bacterium]